MIKELTQRIEEIANLEDDWDGNKASKINPEVIQITKNLIQQLDFPIVPAIIPTFNETVDLEFRQGEKLLCIEILNAENAEIYKSLRDQVNLVVVKSKLYNVKIQDLQQEINWISSDQPNNDENWNY
jgi:hypothetical protein